MADIRWETLSTVEDWSGALQQLLNDAQAAIQSGDQAKRLNVQDELGTFIKRSPTEFASFDGIAFKASNNLFIIVAADALKAISERNAELAAVTKSLKAVADRANKSAKAIKFENVITALDRAKAAAEDLKELERTLANPDQNLLGKIRALAEAIEALRRLAPQE